MSIIKKAVFTTLIALYSSTLILCTPNNLPVGHTIITYEKEVHWKFVKAHLKQYAKPFRLKELFGSDYLNKALSYIEQPEVTTLIYCANNNQVVGFITYTIEPRKILWNKINAGFFLGNKAVINFFCVMENHQNKGYATSLLHQVLKQLEENISVIYATTYTRSCDIKAHYLLKKQGFFESIQLDNTLCYTYYFNRNYDDYDKEYASDDYTDHGHYLFDDEDNEDNSWLKNCCNEIKYSPSISTKKSTAPKKDQSNQEIIDTSEVQQNNIPHWWVDDPFNQLCTLEDYC